MTRNERIEAMAQAMMAGNWHVAPDFAREMFKGYAHLALAAADVEGMVRRAASEGIDLGWDACETRMPEDEFRAKRDAIVRRVIGGGQ